MQKDVKFRYWLTVACHAQEIPFELERMSRPYKVGKVLTPRDLNELPIGKLLVLSETSSGADLFYKVCHEVLGMNEGETAACKATEVVRFVGWVVGQIKKINALFEKTNIRPSNQEVKAGISTLKFGPFGLIDWYAKRMGITNHDDVFDVPWIRIYKCLDMDTKKYQFEKRLQEIRADEYRRVH